MSQTTSVKRERLILLSILLCVVCISFFGYVGYQIHRTWNPWTTTDINLYHEMRKQLVEAYPDSPDILPPSIPTEASNLQFGASPHGALRQGPYIELQLTLPEASIPVEIDRLRDLASSNEESTFTLNSDGSMHFEYRMSSGGTYTRYAIVWYDPQLNTFIYQLGAGY